MVILQFILVAVEVVISILLVVIILMQRAKNEGLGLAFGSGMGEALFGSRAGNILTKLTIAFAIVFMVNTLLLSLVYSGGRAQTLMSRFGIRPVARTAPVGERERGTAQRAPSSSTAPVGGAPTLPGANLGEEAAPVSAPAPEAAPAAAPAQPEPAPESKP
jgi:preprotein translocase subunit SecG